MCSFLDFVNTIKKIKILQFRVKHPTLDVIVHNVNLGSFFDVIVTLTYVIPSEYKTGSKF